MAKGRKKREFLDVNPICFNCGTAKATTVDHVPSRQCFDGRQGPEGFEFPACYTCNSKLSKIEQAMALLIRLADHSERDVDEAELSKMIRGVKNNTPNLLPREFTDPAKLRAALKQSGWKPGPEETDDDAPIVDMAHGWCDYFQAFARKMTLALYYKETGKALPCDHWMRTKFFQYADKGAPSIVEQFQTMLPEFREGQRRNVDLGDQFRYITGRANNESLFAFLAQLRQSWFIVGITAGPQHVVDEGKYILHGDELKLDL